MQESDFTTDCESVVKLSGLRKKSKVQPQPLKGLVEENGLPHR